MDGSALPVCELHKTHSPANLTVELHHVIPVAWQLLWQPAVAPFPGRDPDGRGELWDARTVGCCPTGHRNIHHWIVALMKALPGGSETPEAAKMVLGGNTGVQGTWAYRALFRFKEASGSLQELVAAHEWGMA
jgi:hypothetical protein